MKRPFSTLRFHSPLAALALLGAVATTSFDASAQLCAETELNDQLQYLRRLSLDLRGKLPTVEEYEAVIASGSIPDTYIDDALNSEDFEHQYGRFLRDLLQVNLADITVSNVVNSLARAPGSDIYWQRLRGPLYRGGLEPESCLDQPATFTNGVPDVTCANGICKEGWVMVTPYWSPSTPIKVCAFDAQTNAMGNYASCDENNYDARCGCGSNLDYCHIVDLVPGTVSKTDGLIYYKSEWEYIKAIDEQVTRIGTTILNENRPYTDLITTQRLQFNGPLVHLLKRKPHIPFYPSLDVSTFVGPIADLAYTDANTWVEAEMNAPGAAGVLTSVFFLLRNASNRSRANRFYQSFLCKDFVGPPDGLPPPSEPLALTPNLMVREGCDYCHKELEPASAHWGRYNPIGVEHFRESVFPDQRPECVGANSDPTCGLYLQEAGHPDEQPYLGFFKPLVFSDSTQGHGNDAIAAAVESGPIAIAHKAIDDGTFAACTTRKVFTWMMGRAPADIDDHEVQALTQEFASGYDFKALVRTLVTSDAYRDHRYVLETQKGEQ